MLRDISPPLDGDRMHAILTTGLVGSLDQAANVLEIFCSSSYHGFPKPVAAICSRNSRLESAHWSVEHLRGNNSAVTGYLILCVKTTKPGEQSAFGRCHHYLDSTKCPGLNMAERLHELLWK